jgi:hypothetical protein
MAALKLQVDNAVLHHVFKAGFGGIDTFADVWAGVLESDDPDAQLQRSVKTIYAWLRNGLPTSRDTAMQFFGALGVDPVAAIDFSQGKLQRQFARLRRSFMLGGLSAGGFRPLFDLYTPGASWPDNTIAKTYFQRNWTTAEFTHEAEAIRNTYVTITIHGGGEVATDWPRAFHIAYRRRVNADGLWRPYGAIITRLKEAILVHENGDMQRQSFESGTRHRIRFKTWFGPGPADFLVASIHPFTITLDPMDDPQVPLLFRG